MKKLIFVILLLVTGVSQAQYLSTYRTAYLKTDHQSEATKVLGSKMKAGEVLQLLDSGKQTNGYYHAKIWGSNTTGWIYRGQVKREAGKLPKFKDNPKGADVYVVDVGAGLGCIIKTPSGKFIIYDGGNSTYVYDALVTLHEEGQEIEMVIVSHTDSDHWRSIDELATNYVVKKALYTSYRPDKTPDTVTKGMDSLKAEPGIEIRDLSDQPMIPGTVVYEEGDFKLTFLSGFGNRDEAFASELGKDASKLRNAASIVIKLTYGDQSVLFTGDIVGLKECNKADCDYECISTEQFLLDTIGSNLESQVIIAPHHGARNASCPAFIEAVNPEYVIFSAGNTHKHPHELTARHYLNAGMPLENIYRTDVGKSPKDEDNNRYNNEWVGSNARLKEKDSSFDDHIRIQITEDGKLVVGYLED
ncbi:MAG: MBL fold metallo-hydrolase [Reichenbachiella sp.]